MINVELLAVIWVVTGSIALGHQLRNPAEIEETVTRANEIVEIPLSLEAQHKLALVSAFVCGPMLAPFLLLMGLLRGVRISRVIWWRLKRR
jgi:hypothetical protein